MSSMDRDDETPAERADRNFGDLLQELRVAQTGVQILFAFLLTLVFSARFAGVDAFERIVYMVSLLSAAMAAALIIAPVAYHRVLFRRGMKEQLVRMAHWLASAGLAFLVVSMLGAILLVTDVVLSRTTAVVVTIITGVWFVLLWLVVPFTHRRVADGEDDRTTG